MGSTAKPQAAGTLANATKGLWQKSLRDLITGIRSLGVVCRESEGGVTR